MTSPFRQAHAGLGALLLVACASRTVPTHFPEGSAASLDAQAGPPAPVTRALDADPPLPGEDAAGWAGLGSGGTGVDPHAGHAGHARHGAPTVHDPSADQDGSAGHGSEHEVAP
ncbi:MAG: hypothetical protein H6726_11425 [Sandaracinaceae bacterium]|nr:hypothetical protein [Sandaracinaceae bacterium]